MSSVSKNNPNARQGQGKDAVHIKWVKRARMWAKTTIANGKQTIEWSGEKPV